MIDNQRVAALAKELASLNDTLNDPPSQSVAETALCGVSDMISAFKDDEIDAGLSLVQSPHPELLRISMEGSRRLFLRQIPLLLTTASWVGDEFVVTMFAWHRITPEEARAAGVTGKYLQNNYFPHIHTR